MGFRARCNATRKRMHSFRKERREGGEPVLLEGSGGQPDNASIVATKSRNYVRKLCLGWFWILLCCLFFASNKAMTIKCSYFNGIASQIFISF